MQLNIFDERTEAEKRFDKFHKQNPEVFYELVQLAWQAHNAGRPRIGINMLIEVVRWNRFLQTRGSSYKINNNYAPYYARLIVKQNPQLGHLFQLRRIRV